MAQSNVGIHLKVDADTGQAKGQIDAFSRAVADLNKEIQSAAGPKDWKSIAQLAQKVNEASSARPQVMEMARQTQGGIAGQNISIDTSQAVRNVNELDAAISKLHGHLEAVRQKNPGEVFNEEKSGIYKSLDILNAARQKLNGQEGQPRSSDDILKWAETTGDYRTAAQTLANSPQGKRYEFVPANPQTNQYLQSGQPKSGDIKQRIIIEAGQAKAELADVNERVKWQNLIKTANSKSCYFRGKAKKAHIHAPAENQMNKGVLPSVKNNMGAAFPWAFTGFVLFLASACPFLLAPCVSF